MEPDGSICLQCCARFFNFTSFQTAFSAKDITENVHLHGLMYITQPWNEIEKGKDENCRWCFQLWIRALDLRDLNKFNHLEWPKRRPQSHDTWKITVSFRKTDLVAARRGLDMWYIMEDETNDRWSLAKFAVFADPSKAVHFSKLVSILITLDDPAAAEIHGREIISEITSPELFQLAKEAQQNCITFHENCAKGSALSPLPTRVVDCSDPQNPRLVSNINPAPYIALSYVWGQAQPHSTTTLNVSDYHEFIPYLSLPATIRDGISATHRLGFQYLWTDTLCILQNSDDDKNREIANMCDIYSNASFTIVAASAKKAGDGFLQDREPPSSIAFPYFSPDGRTTGTFFVREYLDTPPDEPINTRAWCFQERILSPRCLIFGSYTLQYQCRHGITNVGDTIPVYQKEDFNAEAGDSDEEDLALPSLASPISSIPNTLSAGHSEDALVCKKMSRTWSKILLNYTRRAITDPTDRLVAVSGVAQVLHREWWPQSTFLAGLWSHNFTQDILWRAMTPSEPYVGKYRAPSWSWAAADGEVESGDPYPPTVDALWKVREVLAVPKVQGNNFAGVKEGCRIVIQAVMRKVAWNQKDKFNTALMRVKGEGTLEKIGIVIMDTTECMKGEGWAVVVGESRIGYITLYGLLVMKARNEGGEEIDSFVRVGMFQVHEKIPMKGWGDEPWDNLEEWMELDEQVITII